MSLEDDLLAEAKARRERLDYPPGGHTSSEMDILSEPAARALAIARREAEEEDHRRAIVSALAERADLRRWDHYIATVGRSFNKPDRWSKVEAIQRAVCRYYSISRAELLSQRRTAHVVRPRQVAMYLCKILTMKSWPEIGRRFADRDHTTALHAHNRIAYALPTDAQLAADIAAIRTSLEGELRPTSKKVLGS